MNQQRSRRFRAAKDAKDRQKMLDDVLVEVRVRIMTVLHSTSLSGIDVDALLYNNNCFKLFAHLPIYRTIF